MIAKVSIRQTKHQAIAKSIHVLSWGRFLYARHAGGARANLGVIGDGDQRGSRKGGVHWIIEVRVKAKKIQVRGIG